MRGPWPFLLLVLLLAPSLGEAAPATRRDAPVDVIVLLEPGAPAAGVLALAPAAVPLHVVDGFVLLEASPGLAAALAEAPGVARVELARPLEIHTHLSLDLTRAAPGPRGLGDDLAQTGAGVAVAVVDSGIDATHPALQGRVKANVRLVDGRFLEAPGDLTGHGTHVAGIVAASDAAPEGHRGVAPGADLVGLDITDRFTTASALLAYDWLYVNAERLDIRAVVNAWGRMNRETFDPSDPVAKAIDRLVDRGVVVLFSSSNHGPNPSSLSFEAQHPRVITVGATDDAGVLMSYSSRGPALGAGDAVKPDVVAPGDAIVSARALTSPPDPSRDVGPLHRTLSGTSQAVPHVAGIVALMLEANPSLAPRDVQDLLHRAAIDLGAEGPDDLTGFGLVDARDAVRLALGHEPDRGNVLVAGGVDRHEDATQLAPTTAATSGGLLGGLGGGGGAAPDAQEVWTYRFPVKPGAERLDFELSWPASLAAGAAPLTATLETDDGRPSGTFTRAATESGRAVLRGDAASPTPGVWTLRVRGTVPLTTDLAARVDVTLPPNATRAAALDPRYHLPHESRAPADDLRHDLQARWIQARLLAQAYPWAPPLLALALAGGLWWLGTRPRAYVPPPMPHEAAAASGEAPPREEGPPEDPTLK